MYNLLVGKRSAAHKAHIPLVYGTLLLGSFCAVLGGVIAPAEARRSPGQYLIPPPPPTPVLAVPPPPVMLPYSEAYANYKAAPSQQALLTLPPNAVRAKSPVRSTPNFTGLSLNTAASKGFGKPRVPYKTAPTAGAAMAASHTDAPAINTWFDSSLRWYNTHRTAAAYYDSMATQAPYWRPESQYEPSLPQPMPVPTYTLNTPTAAPVHHAPAKHHRHARRVVAYR